MSIPLPADCGSILISEESIQERITTLASQISEHYEKVLKDGEALVLVPILTGSYMFAADLSRKLTIPNTVDFLALSSYRGGTRSTGEVKILMDTRDSVWDKHVLILEDIVDSGYTLQFLARHFSTRNPRSLEFCVLLTAPKQKRKVEGYDNVKWTGFHIGEKFVVGYGLDCAGLYRHLPYIAELTQTAIDKFTKK
ncbi:hypoxanthine phosphoribosyltransferase [Acrasis kona]|uniref:Hypoxanthine phosphoribosyltransferase n=1 Tax=Acrasis kona TaxID=1008807 RepID=A0AAW2ZM35_9EUKA